MKNHRYRTAVHSVEPGEHNHATFYLINTTPNRNHWAVTDKALQEALPTILNKPLGCGPEYKNDRHYPAPLNVGTFTDYQKPDGYALAKAEITDNTAWTKLITGEWGPVSVVIKSYRETCSRCMEELTENQNPFNHPCIAEGQAHLQVESFVFDRVDFIDAPAYPQAGYLHQASDTNIPIELLAEFYESNQTPQVNGNPTPQPNPEKKEKKTKMETEQLQEKVTQLEQQLTDEKKLRENLEADLNQLQTARHAEIVETTLQARIQADLVTDPDEERKQLTEYSENFLNQLKADAQKITQDRGKQPETPKTKNHNANTSDINDAIENTRNRLFGYRRTNQ